MKHLDREARDVRMGIVLSVLGFLATCYFWHPFFFVGVFMLGLWYLQESPRRR
jgi:hypothetical protein